MAIRHTHVYRNSSDCDGTYSRTSVSEGDSSFAEEFLSSFPITREEQECVEFDYGFRGDSFLCRANISYDTEEGYVATELMECDDESCDMTINRYRDHRAESMGY